jgi:hypothetical protein
MDNDLKIYIKSGDIREMLKNIRQTYEWGAASLIVHEHGVLDKANIRSAFDYTDYALFRAGQPFDADNYHAVPLREVYEKLALLEKRIPGKQYVFLEGRRDLIDINSTVERYRLEKPGLNVGPLYDKEKNIYPGALTGHQETQHIQSPIKSKIMDEDEISFNKNQFQRIGVGEAFTPELVKQMALGVPNIQHSFNKKFDGDDSSTVFHLKKADSSFRYFLNKFDMAVQKEGQAQPIKKTFYVSNKREASEDGENKQKQQQKVRFTYKKAYNYLAERPVLNDLINKEGREYKAWEQINTKKILTNGNYDSKQYTQNYGFDHEKVLQNYSIKDLQNPEHKQRLIEGHQRGNLQVATFVDKDGKEEKLLTSPSITTGSLHVYDLDKKPLKLDIQIERQLIDKDFGIELKNKLAEMQKQKQTISRENNSETTHKQGQSVTAENKVKTQKQTVH